MVKRKQPELNASSGSCSCGGGRKKSKMRYIWTDERLQVLLITFCKHVQSEKTYRSHSELLNYLKQPLLKLADEETNDFPTENEISEKLTDLANCYRFKGGSYYHLKERVGKDICKVFRYVVRHQKFEEYLPPNDHISRRVTNSNDVDLSMSSCSDDFSWTDRQLRSLVNTYYNYLYDLKHEQSTIEKNGKKCLADLKRMLRWKITTPRLKSKLDKIFGDYKDGRNDYLAFRIRIGKDMCSLFDQLVKFEDYELYTKTDTTFSRSTSSSSRLSSSSRSSRMTDLRKAQSKAEMEQVTLELKSLGLELSEDQLGVAIYKLTDVDKRSGFWACPGRAVRQRFVIRLLGEG